MLNKLLLYVGLFVGGGVATYFLLPTKTVTVTVNKEVVRVIHEKIQTQKTKVTKPNGEIIESTQTTTVATTNEKTDEKVHSKTTTNPKRFAAYAGLKPLSHTEYLVGISYDLWGPISIGGQYVSTGNTLYATVGLHF